MSKREKFVEMVELLIERNNITKDEFEDALAYFEAFKSTSDKEKPAFTDNGRLVLRYMKENKDTYNNLFKAKEIGEGLGISSRTASGAMRKLVTDNYVEKIGENPSIYSITEKGISANLDN